MSGTRVVVGMLKWLPIVPFAGFLAVMSCSGHDPVDAAAIGGRSAAVSSR